MEMNTVLRLVDLTLSLLVFKFNYNLPDFPDFPDLPVT